jgi:hypothetical protein
MPPTSTLRAGFAKLDITPGRDAPLIGYAFRYEKMPPGNEGVHDPLHVRVLTVASGDGPPAVIVNLELATLETGVARLLREAAAEKIETTPDRVIICCTHTHSGPFPIGPADEKNAIEEDAVKMAEEDSIWTEPGRRYFAFLRERVASAAAMAGGKLVPVRLEVQQAPFGIGYNRRIVSNDGASVRHCWNPQEWGEHDTPLEPAADTTCTVAVLRQVNGPRQYVLWNVGAHALALGKTSNVVSADWPGAACRMIEQMLPGAQAMFLFGACGDVHSWISTQEDPVYITPVATACAGFVATLAHATRGAMGEGDLLAVASRTVRFGKGDADLAAWRLGRLRLVAAPVELFAGLSAMLRERVDGPLLVVTEANGRTGYWPTREAFGQGGYEVDIARHYGLEPGDGEKLMDELAALVASLG